MQFSEDYIKLIWDNPGTISEMVFKSNAYKIYTRLDDLEIKFFVFEQNYEELQRFIDQWTNSGNVHILFHQQEKSKSLLIIRHVIRMFHNFVAAAVMLIEHTRKSIRKHYANTDFYKAYVEEVRARFAQNETSRFVEDLRNYTLHYSLPVSGVTVNLDFSEQARHSAFFYIEKSRLVNANYDWDKGRTFLNVADEQIDVGELSSLYYQQVLNFHRWIHTSLRSIHGVDLTWLDDMGRHCDELLGRQAPTE